MPVEDAYAGLPRQVKTVDTATLVALEARARELGLNQRLDPEWVTAHVDPDAVHHLFPGLWNHWTHRPDLPRQLRCLVLLRMGDGREVMSLLDMHPDEFAPLPREPSRELERRIAHRLVNGPMTTVLEWERARSDRP